MLAAGADESGRETTPSHDLTAAEDSFHIAVYPSCNVEGYFVVHAAGQVAETGEAKVSCLVHGHIQ